MYCYILNTEAVGKVLVKFFPIVNLWKLMTSLVWPIWTSGAWLAGFM